MYIYVQSLVRVKHHHWFQSRWQLPSTERRFAVAVPTANFLLFLYLFFFPLTVFYYSRKACDVSADSSYIRAQVGPNIKLPAWYLLDAISKNVPVPYAGLFAAVVADLFLDSYYQVDLITRSKMEEMLMTWRDGGQHGREVFGVVPQVAIERTIWQSSSTSRAPVSRYFGIVIVSLTLDDRHLDLILRLELLLPKFLKIRFLLTLK